MRERRQMRQRNASLILWEKGAPPASLFSCTPLIQPQWQIPGKQDNPLDARKVDGGGLVYIIGRLSLNISTDDMALLMMFEQKQRSNSTNWLLGLRQPLYQHYNSLQTSSRHPVSCVCIKRVQFCVPANPEDCQLLHYVLFLRFTSRIVDLADIFSWLIFL